MKGAWFWAKVAAACGLFAASALAGAACTVSTSNGPVDFGDGGGGGGDDAGGGGTDSGGGGDAGGCAAIGNGTGALVTFETDGGNGECNSCMATSCCDPTTACFSVKDCSDLQDCLTLCDNTPDAGADCKPTCQQVAQPDSVTKQQAFEQCYVNSCRSAGKCP